MRSDVPRRRFEDVDWETDAGVRVSRRTAGFLTALAALGVAFAVDYAREGPLFSPNSVLRDGWDLTQLDWLFAVSLAVFLFYVVWPLAANRRMTAHYWREFRKNPAAVVSLAYLVATFALGLLGPLLVAEPEVALTRSYQPPVGLSVDSSVPLSCVGDAVHGRCHGS